MTSRDGIVYDPLPISRGQTQLDLSAVRVNGLEEQGSPHGVRPFRHTWETERIASDYAEIDPFTVVTDCENQLP
ncbi:MAG: hypothetical protein ACE15E_01075 [Acidobacteriota bacterium]